jgi:hypothetical protein
MLTYADECTFLERSEHLITCVPYNLRMIPLRSVESCFSHSDCSSAFQSHWSLDLALSRSRLQATSNLRPVPGPHCIGEMVRPRQTASIELFLTTRAAEGPVREVRRKTEDWKKRGRQRSNKCRRSFQGKVKEETIAHHQRVRRVLREENQRTRDRHAPSCSQKCPSVSSARETCSRTCRPSARHRRRRSIPCCSPGVDISICTKCADVGQCVRAASTSSSLNNLP